MIGGVSTEGRLTGIQAFKACPEAPTNIAAPGFTVKRKILNWLSLMHWLVLPTKPTVKLDRPLRVARKRRRRLLQAGGTKSVYGVAMLTVSAGITYSSVCDRYGGTMQR